MDKAYDSKSIRQALADQGVEAVIPARSNRTETIHHDQEKPLMHMAPVARVCHQMLRLRLGRGSGSNAPDTFLPTEPHMKQVPDSLLAVQHMVPDDDACAPPG